MGQEEASSLGWPCDGRAGPPWRERPAWDAWRCTEGWARWPWRPDACLENGGGRAGESSPASIRWIGARTGQAVRLLACFEDADEGLVVGARDGLGHEAAHDDVRVLRVHDMVDLDQGRYRLVCRVRHVISLA